MKSFQRFDNLDPKLRHKLLQKCLALQQKCYQNLAILKAMEALGLIDDKTRLLRQNVEKDIIFVANLMSELGDNSGYGKIVGEQHGR